MSLRDYIPARCMNYLLRRTRSIERGEAIRRLSEQSGVSGASRSDADLIVTLMSARAMLPSRPTVLLDVGAYHGTFARLAAKILSVRRVICFEADHDLVGRVRQSLEGIDSVVH